MQPQQGAHLGKYTLVFFITITLFVLVYSFANFIYDQRMAQIKNIEDNINRNILESEIQFALQSEVLCDEETVGNTLLIDELNSLARRLSSMEKQRGVTDPEVVSLKKYYSLLQVKDYLLLKERAKLCGEKPLSILYFYSNTGDCDDCIKMGYVLTSMREDYNKLHIYAFDYNLELSVIQTLRAIYKLEDNMPVLIINRKPYYGFKDREEIESLIPDLEMVHATSTNSVAAE
jgi:hypothetical protein